MVRKYSLCFVDDDEHELKRFKAAFEGEFYVGIGTDLGKAEANLTENMPRRRFHFWRPRVHLYVLDMYFPIGTTNTPEQRAKLAKALGTVAKQISTLKQFLEAVSKFGCQALQFVEQSLRLLHTASPSSA